MERVVLVNGPIIRMCNEWSGSKSQLQYLQRAKAVLEELVDVEPVHTLRDRIVFTINKVRNNLFAAIDGEPETNQTKQVYDLFRELDTLSDLLSDFNKVLSSKE